MMTTHTDESLARLCDELEPPAHVYEAAFSRLQHIQETLSAQTSGPRLPNPTVLPTGSLLLGAAVRPLGPGGRPAPVEFEAVCRFDLDPRRVEPASAMPLLEGSLRAAAEYGERLASGPGWVRLSYEDEGYRLTLAPACRSRGDALGVQLMVPDRTAEDPRPGTTCAWRHADPLRFGAWFRGQCEIGVRDSCRYVPSHADATPALDRFRAKTPLQRSLQVIVRQRDLTFPRGCNRPSTLLLATEAARCYRGQSGLAESLDGILRGMHASLDRFDGVKFWVPNPVVPGQDLAAGLALSTFQRLISMLDGMLQRMGELRNTSERHNSCLSTADPDGLDRFGPAGEAP